MFFSARFQLSKLTIREVTDTKINSKCLSYQQYHYLDSKVLIFIWDSKHWLFCLWCFGGLELEIDVSSLKFLNFSWERFYMVILKLRSSLKFRLCMWWIMTQNTIRDSLVKKNSQNSRTNSSDFSITTPTCVAEPSNSAILNQAQQWPSMY